MKRRFAPVISLDMMKQFEDRCIELDYHLLLAHKVLEDPESWQHHFNRQKGDLCDNPFVIMDNSLVELGYAMSIDLVASAANLVKADVLVLPDKLNDVTGTLNASYTAIENIGGLLRYGTSFMGVVQGNDMQECLQCANELVKMGVQYLSIPRCLRANLGSRVAVGYAVSANYNKPIHFLGFSDNLADDLAAVLACPTAIGIDSSVPIRLGQMGGDIENLGAVHAPRPEGWLDSVERLDGQSIRNYAAITRWLRG